MERKEGKAAVCKLMEDIRNEAAAAAAVAATAAASREMARRLLWMGKMSLEEIAQAAQLPVSEVKEIASQMPA